MFIGGQIEHRIHDPSNISHREDLKNPITPRQYPTNVARRLASRCCSRLQLTRASLNTACSPAWWLEHALTVSAWTLRKTAIQALANSKSFLCCRRLLRAATKSESSEWPSWTCTLSDRMSRSSFVGDRLSIYSIHGSKLPDRRPIRRNSEKREPAPLRLLDCWILATREYSVAVVSVESASLPEVAPSGSDGKKNGAFSGAFGGSNGLLRS